LAREERQIDAGHGRLGLLLLCKGGLLLLLLLLLLGLRW
jgi:hypothetical protein